MKNPSYSDAQRCLRARKTSKQNGNISAEEHKFCALMYEKYPEWYKDTEEEVFNDTVPFGSDVKYKR